jgi:hypothetical protein
MSIAKSEQDRFMTVAYARTLRSAQKAFRHWHERKREDAVQESLSKMWDQWSRLIQRGRDPVPLLPGLIKYALLWVMMDRKVAGRARSFDVQDFRSGLKQQLLSGKGEVAPTDRGDPMNGWINWAVKAKTDDPAVLAGALEEAGLSLEAWLDM